MVHIHSAILPTKRNAFESALMRWMKLESVIQNEVKIEIVLLLLLLSRFSHVRLCATP